MLLLTKLCIVEFHQKFESEKKNNGNVKFFKKHLYFI